MIPPVLFEALALAVMGASGIGLGVLLGWRHPFLLAGMAVGLSGSLRVVAAFTVWSFGQPEWLAESWWVTSVVLALVTGALALWRHTRVSLQAGAVFVALAGLSLATKYVFDIGERHHRDSASAVELAQLVFQVERDITGAHLPEKRGVMYPLLLALGPEDRLFSAVTPLILLSIASVTVWLTLTLTRSLERRWVWMGLSAVAAFTLSVPIARVALTYLNAHTMMALGILACAAGVILARREGDMSRPVIALLVVGVLIGSTARVEGIASVLVILASLAGDPLVRGMRARVNVFALISVAGVSLAWWLESYESEVLASFGVSSLVVSGVAVLGGALVASPLVDRIRAWLFPLAIALVLGMIARTLVASGNPFAILDAQGTNVILGYGGWGVAASALAASLVLLGWRSRSDSYRRLAVLTVLLIITIVASKIFDGGGFGREGFYDSVNRMWLHTIGVAAVTMAVGFAEALQAAARGSWPWSRRASAVYTASENRSPEEVAS